MKDRIREIFNEAGEVVDSSPAIIAGKYYVVQGLLNLLHVSLMSICVPVLSLGKLLELIDRKVTKKIYDRRQYWLDDKKQGQALEDTAMKVDTGPLEVPAVDIEGKGDSDPKAEKLKENEERSTLSSVSYEDEPMDAVGSLVEKEEKTKAIDELIRDQIDNQQEEKSSSSNHQNAMRAPNRKRVGNQRKNRNHSL